METPKQEGIPHKQPNYVGIFFALAALTLIEIGVTFTPLPRIPILLPLAIFKAALVVLFYMHLRFDRRVFSLIFLIGVLMGISLILAFIFLFGPPLLDAGPRTAHHAVTPPLPEWRERAHESRDWTLEGSGICSICMRVECPSKYLAF